jgi:hypothetical protein
MICQRSAATRLPARAGSQPSHRLFTMNAVAQLLENGQEGGGLAGLAAVRLLPLYGNDTGGMRNSQPGIMSAMAGC